VVLLEVTLQRLGQLQEVDVVVGQTVDDHGPAQVLQGKREVPVQGPGEHGLEKHATTRIFVMFDKATNCVRRVDAGIVRIETELVIPLFYPGVQGAAVLAERHAEEELLLGRVPQEERAFRLAVQQPLGLVAVHLTPVEAALGDVQEIRYETVYEVHLSVTAGDGVQGTGSQSHVVLEERPQGVDGQVRRAYQLQPSRHLTAVGVHVGTQELHSPDGSEVRGRFDALLDFARPGYSGRFIAVFVNGAYPVHVPRTDAQTRQIPRHGHAIYPSDPFPVVFVVLVLFRLSTLGKVPLVGGFYRNIVNPFAFFSRKHRTRPRLVLLRPPVARALATVRVLLGEGHFRFFFGVVELDAPFRRLLGDLFAGAGTERAGRRRLVGLLVALRPAPPQVQAQRRQADFDFLVFGRGGALRVAAVALLRRLRLVAAALLDARVAARVHRRRETDRSPGEITSQGGSPTVRTLALPALSKTGLGTIKIL
jgi:hypothetical protein